MKISVLIPSWRRPESLARCLEALDAQRRRPDEVVLVVREDDASTREMLGGRPASLPTTIATPDRPGVIAAENAGLELVGGDVVVFTDDDTAAHPDWLERIEAHFAADPQLGGLGGRDLIMAEGFSSQPLQPVVGSVRWFGRVVGNHSLGTGPTREVDLLKGANMAFRRAAIEDRRIDTALRGTGTEHHWEIDLSLGVKAAGWKLAYDPAVQVDHYEEARHADRREPLMSAEERFDAVHNQAYALLKHLPPGKRAVALTYELLLGTRENPGPLLALERILEGEDRAAVAARMRVATAGRLGAFRTWRRWKRSRR